jgi:outer membrane protein assembly factor BamB
MPASRVASAFLLAFTLSTGGASAQAAADPPGATDWPQWRGPNRDGVSPQTGLLKQWPAKGPALAWWADLHGIGYSAPAVVGDRVFVAAAEDEGKWTREFALCLDATNGIELWRVPLPVGDGNSSADWGPGPRATPAVSDGLVYLLGPRGDLVCLKAADGARVWAVNLKDFGGGIPLWGYAESVLVDGDVVVCTPGGPRGTLLALDRKTGKPVWQSADLKDAAAYASLVATDVGGVRQFVTQTASAAVGVRAADGKLLWRVAGLDRSVKVVPTPVVHGGFAFFTAGSGCELIKLEPEGEGRTKAAVVYTRNGAVANHHGGVVRIGDYVYGHSGTTDATNRWVCLEYRKPGAAPAWAFAGFDKGSLCAADGHLYCYGENRGAVALVEASPEKWKEKGRFDIPQRNGRPRRDGKIWTHPVIANGKLYLRDQELLFCYDVAAK